MPIGRHRGNVIRSFGKPSEEALRHINSSRHHRRLHTKRKMVGWATFGTLVGVSTQLASNPSFRKGVAIVAGLGISGGAWGAGAEFAKQSAHVNKATRHLGRALYEESKFNEELRRKLASKKYVYVDGKGRIRLTNRPTLGVGRMRLRTRKILGGLY